MTCMAFAYLQHRRLAGQRPARSGKNAGLCSGTATIAEPAGRAARHHGAAARRACPTNLLSALPTPVPTATKSNTAQVVLDPLGLQAHVSCMKPTLGART